MAIYKPEDVGRTIGDWIVESAKTSADMQRIRQLMLKVSNQAASQIFPDSKDMENVWGAIYGASTAFMLPIHENNRKTVLVAVLKQIVLSTTEQEWDVLGR